MRILQMPPGCRLRKARRDNHDTCVPNLSNIQSDNAVRMVNFRSKHTYSKTQAQMAARPSYQKGNVWPTAQPLISLCDLHSDLDSEQVLPHIYSAPFVVVVVVSAHTRYFERLQRPRRRRTRKLCGIQL